MQVTLDQGNWVKELSSGKTTIYFRPPLVIAEVRRLDSSRMSPVTLVRDLGFTCRE